MCIIVSINVFVGRIYNRKKVQAIIWPLTTSNIQNVTYTILSPNMTNGEKIEMKTISNSFTTKWQTTNNNNKGL